MRRGRSGLRLDGLEAALNTAKLAANWKSTALGLCILGLALKGSLHFDDAGHLAMTARDWSGMAFGACASLVGMLQKDAGTEVVQTSAGPKVDDSHEVPDSGAPVVQE